MNMETREINFRAWIKYLNKMVTVSAIDLQQGFIKTDNNHLYLINELCVVMQYTGLKDKNGKEIYEGDIICSDTYKTWEWRGVIKFSHGVFGAEWLSNVKSQSMVGSWGQKHNLRKLDDDIIERIEVIGDIYSNPQLLPSPAASDEYK